MAGAREDSGRLSGFQPPTTPDGFRAYATGAVILVHFTGIEG